MRISIIHMWYIMTGVPSINLYLDEKTKKKLKDLAETENRSPSKQVKHMMEFYIENKNKAK